MLEQTTTRPTAEINGIVGGYTGEGAKTVIPGEATAKVSFRLVGEQDPEKIRDGFRAFVRERLPADCKVAFANFGLAPPLQLSFDNPALTKARTVLAEEWGHKAVAVGAGGSIPIVADFKHGARHGFAPGRLRARRRPGAFAEREVRPEMLPQGHPKLGAHPATRWRSECHSGARASAREPGIQSAKQ